MGFRSSDATRLYQTGAPAPHAATKAGVIMLTRQVANEVGKGYRSGAEGNRTPDLRRAKSGHYYRRCSWLFKNSAKSRFCPWQHSWVFAVIRVDWCTTGVNAR